MYVVLTDQKDKTFYGKENPIAIGPFLSAREALRFADRDNLRVISVSPKAGVTDRYFWRDIIVTPVYD